jgi:hypothetical protein
MGSFILGTLRYENLGDGLSQGRFVQGCIVRVPYQHVWFDKRKSHNNAFPVVGIVTLCRNVFTNHQLFYLIKAITRYKSSGFVLVKPLSAVANKYKQRYKVTKVVKR